MRLVSYVAAIACSVVYMCTVKYLFEPVFESWNVLGPIGTVVDTAIGVVLCSGVCVSAYPVLILLALLPVRCVLVSAWQTTCRALVLWVCLKSRAFGPSYVSIVVLFVWFPVVVCVGAYVALLLLRTWSRTVVAVDYNDIEECLPMVD